MSQKCSRCGYPLTPVENISMRRRLDYPQYENALAVKVEGHYGMKIDETRSYIYCSSCADQILDFTKNDAQLFKGVI